MVCSISHFHLLKLVVVHGMSKTMGVVAAICIWGGSWHVVAQAEQYFFQICYLFGRLEGLEVASG